MTSFFAQLFLAIQEHIKTAVPEIRYIDHDFGQLENYAEGNRPAVSWPCCLIDFAETTFDELGQLVQTGNTTISFKLGFDTYSSSSNIATQTSRENALKFYEIENKFFKAFHGWEPDSGICQPLTRISAATDKGREDTYRVRVLAFTSAYEDSEAAPVNSKLIAPIELETEIDN